MKQRKNGFLNGFSLKRQDTSTISIGDILDGKTELSDEGVEIVRDLWHDLTVKSPAKLITEARGYGYPLQSLLDFYVERWSSQDELQEGVEYLQSIETWQDFAPLMELLKGEPAKDMFPCVPNDLVPLIIETRFKEIMNSETIAYAEKMSEKEVIAFLGFESLRKHKGIPIENHARLAEMDVESYKVLIDALKKRADNDDDISLQVNDNESLIVEGYLGQ